MTKCPECGATMWRVGKSEDKIILRCSENLNHILKKKITPKQKLDELRRMIGESPLQAQKRSERYRRRKEPRKKE